MKKFKVNKNITVEVYFHSLDTHHTKKDTIKEKTLNINLFITTLLILTKAKGRI